MADLTKIVANMPRKGAEAEPIEEFPIRDQAPGRIEDVRPVMAKPKGAESLLDGARVESLSEAPRQLTDEEYAEKKRKLPPLIHAADRAKAKARAKPRFGLSWDQNRRDIVAGREAEARAEQAKVELAKAVAAMPMRWDKKAKAE